MSEIIEHMPKIMRASAPVSGLAVQFNRFLSPALSAGEDQRIIDAVLALKKSVDGTSGGSQGLAILNTASTDLHLSQAVLDCAASFPPRTAAGKALLGYVHSLNEALSGLQQVIGSIPPDSLNQIKRELVETYGSDREQHHEEAGMPVFWIFVLVAGGVLFAYAKHKISLGWTALLVVGILLLAPLAAAVAAGIARKRKGY